MKKILTGAVAAIALVGVASPAAAQTNQRHYAATVPVLGNLSQNNPGPGATFAWEFARGVFGIGTRYTAVADAPSDSEAATPTVTTTFNLTGSVNKDCSFYAGNDSSATNIDFGVIGVRTGNNENVNSAFEMVGPAFANIETLTAGCNFNNEVSITKNNVDGLVNSAAGGYDTDEFQANIPYSVSAAWTGVPVNTVTSGTGQSLNVSTSQLSNTKQQGAWRSNMTINFNAPAITNKGLVAGTYAGTTTLVLTAL
ncbi:MAG: hypothetical protein ACTHNA_00055 [Sphingopyxis terrae]|jgi:hypothetical protein|uniref:hypothetical protein n=1 Tax=Sphingopyxis terrae TaxID=33052 RepID=UPI000AAC6B47|nr:hypothetical protein [uncultured Sphingopyxis sp.]